LFPLPPVFRVQVGVVKEDPGKALMDGFFGNLIFGGDLGSGISLVELD
jgi:hypothetical protein